MGTYDDRMMVLEAELNAKTLYIKKLERELEVQKNRGAGRKRKLTDSDIASMRAYRKKGCTFAEIAENLGISVGTVHRYCSNVSQERCSK